MSPANTLRIIFLWRVLGILDQEFSITHQLYMVRRFDEVPRRRSCSKRFVVGGVGQDFPIGGKAISQGTTGMIDHRSFNPRTIGEVHHTPVSKLHEFDLR